MRKEIYLAGGCFWGLQRYFDCVHGVVETEVGYANAVVRCPSYELVCTGVTHAAEAVRVVFDTEMLSLDDVLRLFFDAIDPTTVNRQGNDRGTQYRSGIYTRSEEELRRAERFVEAEQARYSVALAVEVQPLENFWPAEEYHQKYLESNPRGYCHIGEEAFKHARNYKVSEAG